MKMSDVFGESLNDNPIKRLCHTIVFSGPDKDAAVQAITYHDELVEMLRHLVDHDCISDTSLHKECISLLAKARGEQ